MRWSIRNQILLPLIGIQLAVVLGISGLAALWSVNRIENQVLSHLTDLTRTIRNARFPLTAHVLEQMKSLSECDFVVFDPAGKRTASTLVLSNDDGERNLAQFLAPQSVPHPLSKNEIVLSSGRYRVTIVHQQGDQALAGVIVLYPAASTQAALRNAVMFPAGLGVLTLVLTSIAAMLVARRMGHRIQAIERQVAKTTESDFRPIPLSEIDDELRDLAASVNWMNDQLERMTREIRRTERANLIKQLAGGIAHQLRNSLTGARMALQIHQRRCERSDDQSLSVALQQLMLTEEQIRGLIALIRDEHRARVPGKLDRLIQEVEGLLQPLCEHRKIHFTSSGNGGDLVVPDSDQMRAALLNLCMNAIEASTEGGLIHLHRFLSAQQVMIEVSDDGPGISVEIEAVLFEPFQTSKADGMGLGLTLVQQAAQDHSGSVEYARVNGRTVFRFQFPTGQFEADASDQDNTDPPTSRLTPQEVRL